jgi:hypothetical protein
LFARSHQLKPAGLDEKISQQAETFFFQLVFQCFNIHFHFGAIPLLLKNPANQCLVPRQHNPEQLNGIV